MSFHLAPDVEICFDLASEAELWPTIRQARRKRCCLRAGHGGQHLWADTAATSTLLGECDATPPHSEDRYQEERRADTEAEANVEANADADANNAAEARRFYELGRATGAPWKMMKAGTDTGSLVNHVLSQSASDAPTVGAGATILKWTDRAAGTIVKVTSTHVHVQCDKATRIDKNGMSEIQHYTYQSDPDGVIHVFRMTKRGYKNAAGNGLLIGVRQQYHDYSY